MVDIDALYRKWERGVTPPNLTYPSLKGLYQWFLRQCELKGIDPETIDFEALVDPSLTYAENKTILAEMIEAPMTEAEAEEHYEEYKGMLEKQVREKYGEIVEPWLDRIAELERTEKLAKKRYKKIKELERELSETERKLEEEKAKPPEVAAVRLRVLRDFERGIERYRVGMVFETRDLDWALELIDKELAERVTVEVPVEVKPPAPPTAPPEEIFRPLPPKKPPEVPVKVLPPVPEKCPLDGTELIQMEMVPMLITDPLRLTSEEEYWRARIGLPLPTVTAEMIEVPPTMKIWMCRQDHYFERDAAGRLVQRASDFLYRKILRETARLRRLLYPPPLPFGLPPEAVFKPEKLKPPFASPKRWLLETKGLTWGEFLALSDEERKILLVEYERLVRETK